MTQWRKKSSSNEVYTLEEVEARLKDELPHWYFEDGWIRRKYKTSGWKGTLMVVNTVGHLAEAAWHHPDLTVSYAFVTVKLSNHEAKGITDKDFALNCSAVACPVLPRTPFTAAQLQEQLARESTAFFARPENFRVDHAARTVWLSEILKFYTEDFVPAHGQNLIAYANRHAATKAPLDYVVRFTPYDWTVANSRR